MSKLYKAEKELCKIINNEVWIELKKNFWMFHFIQKIKRMTIYKVLHENNVYVFATKYQKGTEEIFILNDELKSKCIEKHRGYISWTGDYKTLFQESFRFLLVDYDFSFNYTEFKNAVDKNNKFFFYGPVYCASFYNDCSCINFILLVQRGDWDVYITDKFSTVQSEIRGGRYFLDGFLALKSFSNYDSKDISSNRNYISLIGQCIYKEINIYNEVYGITLKN